MQGRVSKRGLRRFQEHWGARVVLAHDMAGLISFGCVVRHRTHQQNQENPERSFGCAICNRTQQQNQAKFSSWRLRKPDLPQMDADGKFLLRQCRRLAGEDLSGEQAPRRVSKAPQISKSHTNKIWLQSSNHTPTKLSPSPAQSRQTAQAWRRGAGPRTEP